VPEPVVVRPPVFAVGPVDPSPVEPLPGFVPEDELPEPPPSPPPSPPPPLPPPPPPECQRKLSDVVYLYVGTASGIHLHSARIGYACSPTN